MLNINLKNMSLTIVLALMVSGCSIFSKNKNTDGYHSAAYNDKNRVPQWMAPPKDLSDPAKLDPMNMRAQADFHFALGETYSLAGDNEKAIEEFRLTLIYDPQSATVRTRLAKEYMRLGLLNEAIEQAEESVRLDAKGVEQKLMLGKLYANLKLFDKAVEQYQEVVRLQPDKHEASLFIGAILAEQGQNEKAVKHFEKLAKAKGFERGHLAYYYIGKIKQQTLKPKDLKAAVVAYKKSLKYDPKFEDSAVSLARIYLHQKKKEEAKKLLSQFQSQQGPSVKVANVLVHLYLDAEDFDKALGEFKIIESGQPTDLNTKMKIALILLEKKEYKKAVKYLKSILKTEPKLDKVRFYLAAVYEETKEYSKAITEFSKIPAVSEFYGDATIHSAYLYKKQRDKKKARKLVEEALDKRQDIVGLYTLYASFLDEAKEYSVALTMLGGAIERFPKNTQLLFYRGSMQDKLGQLKETIASMKEVIALDEKHVQALNYLAYTYAEKNMNLDEAEGLVRRALEITPDDGYVMDTLGWVLYKKGDIKKAVTVLEKAFELKKTESIIAEHLGDAYYKYQLPEKAKNMYIQAVKNESDQKNLEKLRNKIDSIDSESQRAPASLPQPTSESAKEK